MKNNTLTALKGVRVGHATHLDKLTGCTAIIFDKSYPAAYQGYGGDIGSFHHNLLANAAGRNWSLAGGFEHGAKKFDGYLDIRNNVVYNWRDRTTDGGVRELNFVNNFYLPGPATKVFTGWW